MAQPQIKVKSYIEQQMEKHLKPCITEACENFVGPLQPKTIDHCSKCLNTLRHRKARKLEADIRQQKRDMKTLVGGVIKTIKRQHKGKAVGKQIDEVFAIMKKKEISSDDLADEVGEEIVNTYSKSSSNGSKEEEESSHFDREEEEAEANGEDVDIDGELSGDEEEYKKYVSPKKAKNVLEEPKEGKEEILDMELLEEAQKKALEKAHNKMKEQQKKLDEERVELNKLRDQMQQFFEGQQLEKETKKETRKQLEDDKIEIDDEEEEPLDRQLNRIDLAK